MNYRHSRLEEYLGALCALALNPVQDEAVVSVIRLCKEERGKLASLAQAHHVVIRALSRLQEQDVNASTEIREWVAKTISAERDRITNALEFLHAICKELNAGGCEVTVIKSLDHWPDLGNDLDLYTPHDPRLIIDILANRFRAGLKPQTLGDKLASKWNFLIPGLTTTVEVHIGRLGQTGEHTLLANRFSTRTEIILANGYEFRVPASEERIMAATLQRMYRHLFIRICDILNTAKIVETDGLDFAELKTAAERGSIWEGVATYLRLVSDFLLKYRGTGLKFPDMLKLSARFGAERICVRNRFFRIPVLPEGASLYARQLTHTILRGDMRGAARLSLLPPLASAAAIAQLTGTNQAIW
jgi:hypothetical protein